MRLKDSTKFALIIRGNIKGSTHALTWFNLDEGVNGLNGGRLTTWLGEFYPSNYITLFRLKNIRGYKIYHIESVRLEDNIYNVYSIYNYIGAMEKETRAGFYVVSLIAPMDKKIPLKEIPQLLNDINNTFWTTYVDPTGSYIKAKLAEIDSFKFSRKINQYTLKEYTGAEKKALEKAKRKNLNNIQDIAFLTFSSREELSQLYTTFLPHISSLLFCDENIYRHHTPFNKEIPYAEISSPLISKEEAIQTNLSRKIRTIIEFDKKTEVTNAQVVLLINNIKKEGKIDAYGQFDLGGCNEEDVIQIKYVRSTKGKEYNDKFLSQSYKIFNHVRTGGALINISLSPVEKPSAQTYTLEFDFKGYEMGSIINFGDGSKNTQQSVEGEKIMLRNISKNTNIHIKLLKGNLAKDYLQEQSIIIDAPFIQKYKDPNQKNILRNIPLAKKQKIITKTLNIFFKNKDNGENILIEDIGVIEVMIGESLKSVEKGKDKITILNLKENDKLSIRITKSKKYNNYEGEIFIKKQSKQKSTISVIPHPKRKGIIGLLLLGTAIALVFFILKFLPSSSSAPSPKVTSKAKQELKNAITIYKKTKNYTTTQLPDTLFQLLSNHNLDYYKDTLLHTDSLKKAYYKEEFNRILKEKGLDSVQVFKAKLDTTIGQQIQDTTQKRIELIEDFIRRMNKLRPRDRKIIPKILTNHQEMISDTISVIHKFLGLNKKSNLSKIQEELEKLETGDTQQKPPPDDDASRNVEGGNDNKENNNDSSNSVPKTLENKIEELRTKADFGDSGKASKQALANTNQLLIELRKHKGKKRYIDLESKLNHHRQICKLFYDVNRVLYLLNNDAAEFKDKYHSEEELENVMVSGTMLQKTIKQLRVECMNLRYGVGKKSGKYKYCSMEQKIAIDELAKRFNAKMNNWPN